MVDIKEALVESVRNTFADMLFLDVMESGALDLKNFSHIIRIRILDPENLELVLWLPLELKIEIAETIYGIPWDEISDTEIDDSLLELLNVLAGNFLSVYAGPDKKYNISLPEILFDEDELERNDRDEIFFNVEGKPLKISFNRIH